MRIRILSDLHLGHSASRIDVVEKLNPLFEEVDHLILAGDIWQERTKGERFRFAQGMYDELRNVLDERELSYEHLRGNHDPQTGVGVSWLANRKVLVTHGDAVYDDATPWSREMPAYRDAVDSIVSKYAPKSHLAEACVERALEIANTIQPRPMPKLPPPFNFFVTALWPPSRTFEMIRVWQGMGEQGLHFLKHSGEGAKVLVCGHFHRPGIWEKDGYLMINTGAFMQGCRPWMVDINLGSKITAREIIQEDEGWRPGPVKGRWLLRE